MPAPFVLQPRVRVEVAAFVPQTRSLAVVLERVEGHSVLVFMTPKQMVESAQSVRRAFR